jgi:methionyl-tRNA formyltransferase
MRDATTSAPGTCLVSKDELCVMTGADGLVIERVKPAGKGAMDAAAWLRGARLVSGTRLGS